jgi:large subunit ribosomal protein L6
MKLEQLQDSVRIPEGCRARYEEGVIYVEGPHGKNERRLQHPYIKIDVQDNAITLSASNVDKKKKRLFNTMKSHIKNLIKGVHTSYTYKLKICSGHFPMNVKATNTEVTIKNFLGEKKPRVAKLSGKCKVTSDGQIITVESYDKELAGQDAASIEQLTRITNRDRRIFQDGIFIIEKAGKAV